MNRIGDNLHHVGANKEIIKAFTSKNVEFILVGGLAVSWFCPSRQANDMDILVNPTIENSQKIYDALVGLNISGLESLSFSKPGIQAPIKKHYYMDIITPSKNGPTYNELLSSSVLGKLYNIPVHIASSAMLIRMKEAAALSSEKEAEKHRNDIALLNNAI